MYSRKITSIVNIVSCRYLLRQVTLLYEVAIDRYCRATAGRQDIIIISNDSLLKARHTIRTSLWAIRATIKKENFLRRVDEWKKMLPLGGFKTFMELLSKDPSFNSPKLPVLQRQSRSGNRESYKAACIRKRTENFMVSSWRILLCETRLGNFPQGNNFR